MSKTPDGPLEGTLRTKVLFKKRLMRVESTIDENDYLKEYLMVLEISGDGDNRTKVHSELYIGLQKPANRFFMNAYMKVRLKRVEEVIREIVDDPLPEDD